MLIQYVLLTRTALLIIFVTIITVANVWVNCFPDEGRSTMDLMGLDPHADWRSVTVG